MRMQIARHHAADAILPLWEEDGVLDAWTLDELAEDLGAYPRDAGPLGSAFAGSDERAAAWWRTIRTSSSSTGRPRRAGPARRAGARRRSGKSDLQRNVKSVTRA